MPKQSGQGVHEFVVRLAAGHCGRIGVVDFFHRTGIGRNRRPHRQILAAHVGERQRRAALHLAGVHWPQRLWQAERRVRAADDGAALVLEEILQFADAALDLLLSRLRHSRRRRSMRWSSVMDATAPASKSTEHDPDPQGRVSAKWAPVFRIDHAQKRENFYRSITLSRVGAFSCAGVRSLGSSTFVARHLRALRVLTPSTTGLVNRGLYRGFRPRGLRPAKQA
jgi:hypothetical protein